MSSYNGDSDYDASPRPDSRAGSALPDACDTLLDPQLLARYQDWLSQNPGDVVTLDPTTCDLIRYIFPRVSNANKRAVEPRSLDNIFKQHGIALPQCFCTHKRNNEVLGTETEYVKRKKVFHFVCRRRTGGCGYSVSMDRFNPSRAPTDDAKTIAGGGSLFAASRAQYSPQLIVFYADSTFPVINTSDSTPQIASSSSDNPRKSSSIGPHRVRDQDKQKVRSAPYTVDPVSRPCGVIERQRTPYAIAPAPSSSAAPALARSPPPASPKLEPLPDSIMHSAFNLAAEGMPRTEFDDMFVVCHRCHRIVFAETFGSHHPSVCRGF